jgi:mono/diheme cytochrome c family protein
MNGRSPEIHRRFRRGPHAEGVRRLWWLAALGGLVLLVEVQARPPWPEPIRRPPPPGELTPVERGRQVYARYGCAMCHGERGQGGVANPNAETEGKVPAVMYVAEGYTAEELAALIRRGTPTIGKADPQGPVPPYRMPGWGDRMSEGELADLVAYLLSLYPTSAEGKWR